MKIAHRAATSFALSISLALGASAAVPNVVNYQGRLTDNTAQQNPIDATLSMDFSVWDSSTGGASLWSETQSVQVVKGLFNVLLGSATPIPGSVFSGGATRYFEIRVGGETLTPRQRIATAPYASVAGSADNAASLGGVGASSYQQRIATPCPAGYAINAVAADGTATCIQGLQGPPGPAGAGLETGGISGTLENCGGPAPGALVYVPGRSAVAYSATDGTYLLTYLPAGSYTVQYKTPGTFGASTINGVSVSAGQTTPRGATFVGDNTIDAANCGACGTVCSSNNITALCVASLCAGECTQAFFKDCNANKQADGCEIDIATSVDNCGACGIVCSSNNITRTCVSSVCGGSCSSGFGNCDGNAQSNGCETNTQIDASHCGGCALVCSSNHIPTPTCGAGNCTGTCSSGWGDCDLNKRVNGCETDVTSSSGNCGACAAPCSSTNITPACSGGNCTGTCLGGFNDCDGNKRANGCETNVTNNVAHCGVCNSVCSSNNITPVCNAGACTGTCNPGFADCDSNKRTNGCEVNTQTSTQHCGGCNQPCGGGQSCVNGSCV